MNYRQDLPLEEIQYLAPILHGELPQDKFMAAHCALEITDFGLGKVAGGVQPVVALGEGDDVERLAHHFDALLAEHNAARASGSNVQIGAGLPWAQIIAILTALIQKWLKP